MTSAWYDRCMSDTSPYPVEPPRGQLPEYVNLGELAALYAEHALDPGTPRTRATLPHELDMAWYLIRGRIKDCLIEHRDELPDRPFDEYQPAVRLIDRYVLGQRAERAPRSEHDQIRERIGTKLHEAPERAAGDAPIPPHGEWNTPPRQPAFVSINPGDKMLLFIDTQHHDELLAAMDEAFDPARPSTIVVIDNSTVASTAVVRADGAVYLSDDVATLAEDHAQLREAAVELAKAWMALDAEALFPEDANAERQAGERATLMAREVLRLASEEAGR